VRMASTFFGRAPCVADIDSAKREAALAAGASQAFDPRESDSARQVLKATGGGVATAIDFVGAPSSTQFAMQSVRRAGRVVVVGLFGGSLDLALPLLPLRSITLQGSYVGSLAELRELVGMARARGVPQIPIQERPLAAAQESLEDLKAGRVLGRVVLHP
jgi:D-arabinose 1-dehydrogenase-like Zn-dependent alcohol dehydrogenase